MLQSQVSLAKPFANRTSSPSSFKSGRALAFGLMIWVVFCGRAGWSQPAAAGAVWTYHYDNSRTGQNINETVLTPANVNTNAFGKLFTYPVDGQIYAEPLFVPGVIILGQGTRNVVFVATQHDSVYAFDADNNGGPTGGLLWHVSLGTSAATPNNDFGNRYGPYHDIDPEVGITSTPVIDLTSGTMYTARQSRNRVC